jgi:hypothetical protein
MPGDTPHGGQARKSAQTAEVSRSLQWPGYGEFPRKQRESAAFPVASPTPSQALQATVRHIAVAMSPAHLWKIHPRILVQFGRGFAPGFATLVQITRSTAITFAILSRGVLGHAEALADILSKCGPLSDVCRPSGRIPAPGFRTWDRTFRTRPQIHPLLPYAFQRYETVVWSSGNQNRTSPHIITPFFHMFRRHFGLFFIFLCAWGCVSYIVLYSLL